jgi:hypothetical protein
MDPFVAPITRSFGSRRTTRYGRIRRFVFFEKKGLAGYFFFCANIMTICLPSISGFCSIDA